MVNNYPKVLIFGQSFNKNTGGGITLSNLFEGWEIDKIAVANAGHGMLNIDFSVCNNFYLLGEKEHKWVFPFNKLQKQFASGLMSINLMTSKLPVKNISLDSKQVRSYRKLFVDKIFLPFLNYWGVSPVMSKIIISEEFKSWVSNYAPDIIYVQISNFESINFVNALKQCIPKPLVLHMMDDWPSVVSGKGPLKKYWDKKIDIALRNLMSKCDMLMSISDAMTEEYEKRYGFKFLSFHNPINIDEWLPFSKKDWNIKSTFKILYTGRIGTANTQSIKIIAEAVDFLSNTGMDIILDIYSPNCSSDQAKSLRFLKGVTLKNIVPHNQIPALLPSYDLLVLPLDFDKTSIKFAKLSMPTKASEFMISGTPILVYAPLESALAKYAIKKQWAYLVSDANKKVMIEAIEKIFTSALLREQLGQTAKELAIKTEDALIVRKKFKEAICSIYNR